MTTIASNLQAIQAVIMREMVKNNRPVSDIKLLAVSKTFTAAAIREAYAAGLCCFAESYVQEALPKLAQLSDIPFLEWHFIGPIQSNKTRAIAQHFSWVHSVDRLKIAQRLSEQRTSSLPPLQICLQVNIGGEVSKSGLSPNEVFHLAQEIRMLPNLALRGLMTVPPPTEDEQTQREYFAQLRRLRDELNQQGMALDSLSMGMSHDFVAAIAEGATMLRIGSAIFGERTYAKVKEM